MNMKTSFTVLFLFSPLFSGAEAGKEKLFEVPRTKVIPIQSSQSGWQYELYIKLPEGYSENSDIKYPVLYFTDAMWHFEILSASTESLIQNVILVGISWQKYLKNDLGEHASRFRDYSIKKSNNPEHQAKYHFGQAGLHLTFIRNDVIKFVEKNYRTDPENRTYFGYSLGGLLGTYILLEQPDTFKNYILGSPSLKRNIPYLPELEPNATSKHKGLKANVFLSFGSMEKERAVHAEELISLLKTRNQESVSITQVVIEGDHQTAFPMTGVRSVTWLSKLLKERN